MNTNRISFLSGMMMLLCTFAFAITSANACPVDMRTSDGTWGFRAPIGSLETRIVTVTSIDEKPTMSIAESEAFTMGAIASDGKGGYTFTVTFHPGPNAGPTSNCELTLTCSRCTLHATLVGTVSSSGVANMVPNDVSINVTPNPATDHINILTSGVRSATISIFDLLGKELASTSSTSWKWDATNITPGVYIVRIAGESSKGEAFLISRRIVIAR